MGSEGRLDCWRENLQFVHDLGGIISGGGSVPPREVEEQREDRGGLCLNQSVNGGRRNEWNEEEK